MWCDLQCHFTRKCMKMDLLRIAHINSDKMLKTLGEAGIRVTKNFEAQL